MADLKTELARSVAHNDREGVGANDASRGVDSVEIGRAVDAVEDAEAVLELAISDSEVINISAKFDSNEAAATVIDGASRFDDGVSSANRILNDLPKASVGESGIRLRDRNSSGFAIVAATEEAPTFQRSVVRHQQGKAFDLKRESVFVLNDGNDLGETLPSHLRTGLNVAIFNVVTHNFFFLQCVVVN